MGKKPKKTRADFRKNRAGRPRASDLTRKFETEELELSEPAHEERISGKGELTRKRTVRTVADDAGTATPGEWRLEIDESVCLRGRVLKVHGLYSIVQAEDGRRFRCATRRLLKTLSTELRHVVAAGDRVLFRPEKQQEGLIERVEPRHGVLSRASRGRQHTLVANVDQLLIVTSAAEPYLKPNLIDRFLVSAEQGHIPPLILINKVDLIERALLEPLIGVYSQMGYLVLLTSTVSGLGLDRLHRALAGRETAIVGQSGVGKSSLLNAIEPGLKLRIGEVSEETQKGRHTTTTAELLPLAIGGYVVDTPGIRQFQLWDVIAMEVAGLYRDLRPFVNLCKFPDCTHRHEEHCAVKSAVADDLLDARRYESYLNLFEGDLA